MHCVLIRAGKQKTTSFNTQYTFDKKERIIKQSELPEWFTALIVG